MKKTPSEQAKDGRCKAMKPSDPFVRCWRWTGHMGDHRGGLKFYDDGGRTSWPRIVEAEAIVIKP